MSSASDAADLDQNRLRAAGRRLEVEISESQAQSLMTYLTQVLRLNEQINVTSVRDFAQAWTHHLEDSLAFFLHLSSEGAEPEVVIDIGTGGGFPGAVIARMLPKSRVHLVESRGKKLNVVREAWDASGSGSIHLHHGRIEELARIGGPLAFAADVVLARGVGKLSELMELATKALKRGGVLVAWKSLELPPGEEAAASVVESRLGFRRLADLPYESFKRCRLIRYRKEKS